jgi:hypothetical protein
VGSSKTKERPEAIEPQRLRPLTLAFAGEIDPDNDPRTNLSAAAFAGSTLFVADDEAASVHRFAWNAGKRRFDEGPLIELGKLYDLPEKDKQGSPGEMDIEGLAVDGGALWIVGSHSLGRKKPKDGHSDAQTIDRLAQIKRAANRHFLGRLGLKVGADGAPEPDPRDATCLELTLHAGRLSALLSHDRHLAASIGMPAKENGFDIEGLAVSGERVFLGLRGPVLRGWAVVVELRIPPPEGGRLDLAPFDKWILYRKHFLDLDGLGVRELLIDPATPDDLLILAGPTMDLDGPVLLYRWRGAATHDTDAIVRAADLGPPLRIPFGHGCDHAEAVALLPPDAADGDTPELLVIYDSPAKRRLQGTRKLVADAVSLGV